MLLPLLLLAQTDQPKSVPFPFETTDRVRVVRSISMPEGCERIRAIAPCPDLDGDGIGDIVVGGGFTGYPPMTNGFVAAYSTKTGGQLWVVRGESSGKDGAEALGIFVLTVDDIDGDGVRDVVAGAPRFHDFEGRVHFLSGRNGSRIALLTGSEALAVDRILGFGACGRVVGDIDGDGVNDLLLGDEFYTVGKCGIFSAKTRKRLQSLQGGVVGGVGDVDGDGVPDVVTSPALPKGSTVGDMRAEPSVMSGKTGKRILKIAQADELGRVASVDLASDLDGDGSPDVIVGVQVPPDDPNVGPTELPWPRNNTAERIVQIRSTKTGKLLRTISTPAYPKASLIEARSLGDLNGDGFAEVLAQSWLQVDDDTRVRISIHDGADASVIANLERHTKYAFPSTVSAVPDTNGNGRPEMVIGTFNAHDPIAAGIHFVEIASEK